MIEAYVYASCTSCRKTEATLTESGATYSRREFFRDRFTEEELRGLLNRAGMGPFEVLSRRSKVYKARQEEMDTLSDDDLIVLMLAEPTLLRRPLIVSDSGVILGHNPSKLAELVAASN